MNEPERLTFDRYLDSVFAGSNRLDACVNMLTVFLESIDSCRDNPTQALLGCAPSIVDQVSATANRAQRLERHFRDTAERRGPEFQTPQLGAVLWWTGMALHKAAAAAEASRDQMAKNAWMDAFFEIHTLLYDTISALSLLSAAEGMIERMETESTSRARPN